MGVFRKNVVILAEIKKSPFLFFLREGYYQSLYLRYTRKYQLHGYILGVLTHTSALDRLLGGDIFKVCIYVGFASHSSGLRALLEL